MDRDRLIYDVAPALFDGGWRASDKEWMLEEFNSPYEPDISMTEEEADIICEELARLEARESEACDDDQ